MGVYRKSSGYIGYERAPKSSASSRTSETHVQFCRVDSKCLDWKIGNCMPCLEGLAHADLATTSQNVKARILNIQDIALTSQATINELQHRQRDMRNELQHFGSQALEYFMETQACIKQAATDANTSLLRMDKQKYPKIATIQASSTQSVPTQLAHMKLSFDQLTPIRHQKVLKSRHYHREPEASQENFAVRISVTMATQQCPSGCSCRCHTRSSINTPFWLRSLFGQLLWSYNSSISIYSCDYTGCRKTLGRHHVTYYFPPWLFSRAIVASANLNDVYGAGAKLSIKIPLIIPEEDHLVWSLVMAGNLEQLQQLLSQDRNLFYVRNQWGQSLMHVSTTKLLFNSQHIG